MDLNGSLFTRLLARFRQWSGDGCHRLSRQFGAPSSVARLGAICCLLLLSSAGCTSATETGTISWIRNAPSGRTLPSTVAAVDKPLAAVEPEGADLPALDDAELLRAGAQLYEVNCAPCHNLNGEGNLGRFPALNDSPLVFGQIPTPLIQVVLYGRNEMPAFAPALNNVELAAILSYVRQAWDNQASIVEPEQIRDERQRAEP